MTPRIEKFLSAVGVGLVMGSLFLVMGLFGRDLGRNIRETDDCWSRCHEECRGQKPDPEVVDHECYCYCTMDRTVP